ncbi:MAG: Holliday junction branch migration protein RuvA [Lachnospiraceae bacterium]|nr:Holliday junction branch migration protein RuvA [Lachnospiraceae bacterium]
MYAYIKGTLEEIGSDKIVVEAGGIGYNILMSPGRFGFLPPLGDEIKVYTYTNVREDAMLLFGFLSREELDLFKKLIGVSGIGPKGGLSILSVLSVQDVILAIVSGDSKKIAKAPGIGAKTAERVIIDLKDKVDAEDAFSGGPVLAKSVDANDTDADETVLALVALGYGMREAKSAVSKARSTAGETADSEKLLKLSLKYL